MIEEGDGVGGAWHWNTYPGVAVDIPSFSYQFSFEQRADWSRVYAPGDELKAYAEHCVDKYDVRRRDPASNTRDRRRARSTTAAHLWRLDTADGDDDHRALRGRRHRRAHASPRRRTSRASRTSPARPCTPRAGTTTSTSRGKRVGIIGTGASAVQVIPSIAPEVEHLTVFQRTPIWCLPKPDAPLPAPARAADARCPGAQGRRRGWPARPSSS